MSASDKLPWPELALGDICEFRYGKSLPESNRRLGDVLVYGSNGVVGRHNEYVSTGPAVVVGRKGSFGEIHYSDVACWPIDTTYYVDGTSTDVHLRWLFHRLRGAGLKSLNRAAAVPGLNRDDAYRQRVQLPPLPEQRRIAEVLDRAETLRAQRRQALAQLDAFAEAIFLDMFGDTIATHHGWPIVGINHICELIVDCVNRTAPVVEGPTPFKMIRTTNVKAGRVDLTESRYATEETFLRWNRRTTPRRGDVLLTREAPVGEVGMLDSDDQVFLGQRLMLYRVDPRLATAEYLLAAFRSSSLRHQFDVHGSGSTVKHLPLPACRNFRIVLPPLAVQKQYSVRMERLNGLRSASSKALTNLNALFTSLQHRAFRGEL